MLKNDSFSSFLQSISSSITIGIIYFLILKYLGKDSLGVYSLIVGFFSFFSIFGTGVSGTLLRYLPPLDKKLESNVVANLLNSALILNGLIGLIILLLFILFKIEIVQFYFIDLFKSNDFQTYFNLSLIIFYLNLFNTTFLFYFDGIQLIHVRNKIVITSSIILLLTFLTLLYLKYGLMSIFIGLLAQSISQLMYYVYKVLKLNHKFKLKIRSWSIFYSYGNKFQFLNIIIAFQEFIIRHLITRFFNLASVGIYEIISKIFIQLKSLITLLVYPVLPKITKSFYKKESSSELFFLFLKMKNFIFHFGSIVFSTFFSIGTLSLVWFFKDDLTSFNDTIVIFSTISIANYIGLLTVPIYYFIQGIGMIRKLIFYHSICTFVSIILYYFFNKTLEIKYFNIPFLFAMIICSSYLLYSFNKIAKFDFFGKLNFNHFFIVINLVAHGIFMFFDKFHFHNINFYFFTASVLIFLNIISVYKSKQYFTYNYFNEK